MRAWLHAIRDILLFDMPDRPLGVRFAGAEVRKIRMSPDMIPVPTSVIAEPSSPVVRGEARL